MSIVGLLDASIRMAEIDMATEKVDLLKVGIEKLQASLRAKMSLVETEEDALTYKPLLDGIKEQIKNKRLELLEAQALDEQERKRLHEQLDSDFHAIMEQELLDHSTYQRLMQETIHHLTVTNEALTVHLNGDRSFSIPRIDGKHHAKRLMRSTLLCDTTDETIEGVCHYQLHFFDGEEAVIEGGDCVYEDDNLTVCIHWPEHVFTKSQEKNQKK